VLKQEAKLLLAYTQFVQSLALRNIEGRRDNTVLAVEVDRFV
jgi:hypothetical protein